MEGQARSPRQKLYPCNRLLGRTHLGGLVCISRSSNSAFWVAVVRSRWVMLWTRSLPAASGMSHPSYRLACRVLQRSGYALTTNGVEQHQVGGEPSFLPRCRQLVPRLFIRCNKLSPEICFRVEAPNCPSSSSRTPWTSLCKPARLRMASDSSEPVTSYVVIGGSTFASRWLRKR